MANEGVNRRVEVQKKWYRMIQMCLCDSAVFVSTFVSTFVLSVCCFVAVFMPSLSCPYVKMFQPHHILMIIVGLD